MAIGFRLYGQSGQAQIDSDYVNVRLVQKGSVNSLYFGVYYGAMLQMPFDVRDECPLILIRPGAYNQYVGGVYVNPPHGAFGSTPASPLGEVYVAGQGPFEYAIFSTLGTPVRDAGGYGLRLRRADGSLAYTSEDTHPRIVELHAKAAADWGWPVTYTTNVSGIPWFLGNALITTGLGVGDTSESMGAVMAKSNGSGSFTVQLRDAGRDQDFPNLVDRANYNPYRLTPAYFGVAELA